ncbi:MAG: prepilin peptidase [Candidatus Micrarchaeota archaeon]
MIEYLILFFITMVIYSDLKSRIIPDHLNFLFMFIAISLTIVKYEFDPEFLFFNYAIFFGFNFLFAYLMYKLGVWAGGDVKFFTALMAYLPLYSQFSLFSAIAIFLTAAVILIPITMIYYYPQILKLHKYFHRVFIDSILKAAKGTSVSFVFLFLYLILTSSNVSSMILLPLVVISFFVRLKFKYSLPFLVLGCLFMETQIFASYLIFIFTISLLFNFMRESFHIISEKVLKASVSIGKLKEGAIPVNTYYLQNGKIKIWSPREAFSRIGQLAKDGQRMTFSDAIKFLQPKGKIIIDALKARGVSISEIKELKRRSVKEILVKESLPFAPVIAFAFLLYRYLDILRLFGL